jgi:hypothetical protein
VYLDLGDNKSKVTTITGPGGNVGVPVDSGTHSDVKGFVTTTGGGYSVMRTPEARMDVLAGLRYTRLKTRLDWELSGPLNGVAASGSVGESKDLWDGIVGVRGRTNLGGNWDFRYYLDAGAGSSRFTWQAVAGVGYRFNWGDVVLSYRHLAYDMKSDRPVSDMTFSGPQFVVGFTF